jgi:hypothetical protein
LGQKINAFWANSKRHPDSSFARIPECVPVEVKVFGFFLALQARYGSKLCYIGFRSGTIDGPGFIGSPIFYLDDTREWRDFENSEYLWNGLIKRGSERMMFLTRTTNTFVRINIMSQANPIKLSNDEAKQLGSALYLYMSSLQADDPLWTKRIELMTTENG